MVVITSVFGEFFAAIQFNIRLMLLRSHIVIRIGAKYENDRKTNLMKVICFLLLSYQTWNLTNKFHRIYTRKLFPLSPESPVSSVSLMPPSPLAHLPAFGVCYFFLQVYFMKRISIGSSQYNLHPHCGLANLPWRQTKRVNFRKNLKFSQNFSRINS